MKTIKIKSISGQILFTYTCENNTIKITLETAVEKNINLSNANLSNARLHNADLSYANLSNANLFNANLSNANLYNADLTNADLSNANLYNANLYNARLFNCIGNMKEVRTIQLEQYMITFTKDILQIGCKNFSHEQWKNFSDDEISKMDTNALTFWKKWKDFIFQAIELSFHQN